MKRRASGLASVAPLLVGASAAVVAEVAIGILLYAGPGLMRSLTTVLAVEGAALAAGLWSTPRPGGPPIIDRLRRRWLFCLLTFIAAAFFGTSWSVVQDLGGGALGQGLGLAVLAALPLYACGLVLGGMSAIAADGAHGRLPGPGAAAALGAALGFVLTGTLLPRAPIPASLLVACLVLLSAGGLVYGVVLAARPLVLIRAERPSAPGDVRVEDRLRVHGIDARYLLEGGHVRRRASLVENGLVPWDVTVARSILDGRAGPARVLAVGGGASALPRALLAARPDVSVDILERNPAVVDLARDHFDTAPSEEPDPRVRLRVGNLEDLLAATAGPYDLVLVDTAALAPLGGVDGLSLSARRALLSAVAAEGVLAVGPLRADPPPTGDPREWRATELRRRAEAPGDEEEVVILGQRASAAPLIVPIGDFEPRNGGPPGP